MARRNHGSPPPENTSSGYGSKRRISHPLEPSGSHSTQRRRLGSKSETSTRNPNNPSRPNRFKVFRSSSRHRRKKRDAKSSNKEEFSSRRWVSSSTDFSNYTDKVVVVSYNILGVDNALKHMDLYPNIPRSFLDWDRRKRLILEEMNNYNASILCFQEVDHFNDLNDLFQKSGFKGVHKARTGEALDGCAVFWKDKAFTLLGQQDIEFQRFGLRNNVAQLCVLEVNHDKPESDACALAEVTPSTRKTRFVIGNIHVLFNPNRGDIKLGQVRLLLDKAYKLSQQWGSIPVIIAGDLNSVPQSAIYEFLSSSKLDIQLYNRRSMSGQLEIQSRDRVFRSQICDEASMSMSMSVSRQELYKWSIEELRLATGVEGGTHLQHHLKLCSAYSGVPGNHRTRDDMGEPLATSYHSKFMGTVDYIWHSEELVPVRVLETVPVDILKRTRGLPTEKWGSDHLALVCELAFANNGSES